MALAAIGASVAAYQKFEKLKRIVDGVVSSFKSFVGGVKMIPL